MSDLLQTIKDQIAKEWFKENRPHVHARNQVFNFIAIHIQLNELWPEVCKRYAFEVAKASLKNASENVKRYRNISMEYEVCKESITDESNIKL